MKKYYIYLTFLLYTLCTVNVYPQEQERNFSVVIESGLQSKYVWRGLTYNTGIVIQPSLTAGYYDLYFQMWGNYTANDVNDEIKRHEIDFILWYDFIIDDLTVAPSFNYYNYPDQDDSPPTVELGLGLTYSLDDVNISLTLSEDIKEAPGAIAALLEAEYEGAVTDELSAGLNAGIGWSNKKFNEYYIETNNNAVSFISLQGTINYFILEGFSVSPFIQNFIIVDQDIKKLLYDNVFNYGLMLSIEL